MSPNVVGRDTEITRLRGLVQQAVRGQGRAVLLEGEPGVGKSVLLDVVATECGQLGMRILRGAAEEMEQRVPFAAVGSCLTGTGSAHGAKPAWTAYKRAARRAR